jgi:hypothetical protein
MSFVHAPLPARADVYWNGGSSSVWSTAANWSGDVVPGSGDDVLIVAGAPCVASAETPVGHVVVGNASANGALNMISGGG